MSEIVFEEFLPKVYIYKNLMPHAKEIAEYSQWFIENNKKHDIWDEYTQWAEFGQNISFNDMHVTPDYDTFPKNAGEKQKEYYYKEKRYIRELIAAFETSTAHYLKAQNFKKPETWRMMRPAICRYVPTTEETIRGRGSNDRPMAMTYHTDYEILKEEMPGDKFALTCAVYLNDDYVGGGIEFLENGVPHLYKPKAGDVIVFPSGNPKYFSEEFTYYHGVEAIESGNKFFVRMFYVEPYEGSKEWLANQEKYGKDVWMEMEQARIVAGMRKHETTMLELNTAKPLTFKDVGIDPEKECGLEEFRS